MSDVKAAFLGPKAENDRFFEELMEEIFRDYVYWRRNFHPEDGRVIEESDKRTQEFQKTRAELRQELFSVLEELKEGVPLHSLRHLGDMVSDQLMAAQIGYIAALLYNQNNVTGRVSPVTTRCEFDYIDSLAEMIGLPPVARSEDEDGSWGHLASGGTTANMEALWAARNLKYYAVSLKLLSEEQEETSFLQNLKVQLPNPDSDPQRLEEISVEKLINLAPRESYELREKAVHFIQEHLDLGRPEAKARLDEKIRPYSVQTLGIAGLMRNLEEDIPLPRIYAPKTVHYCWKKAADALGLGQRCLIQVDVDERYRMDIEDLRAKHDPKHPTLMIVGVAGTTEEGAFDPLHELVDFRQETEQNAQHSFWIHADAAWGGYFASLLPDMQSKSEVGEKGGANDPDWKEKAADIKGYFDDLKNDAQPVELFDQGHPITAEWVERVSALSEMDSVVVDPHKMGYIPYPAGAVLFADARARDAVSHDAPYLAWEGDGDEGLERKFMGRWTFEGSRPGTSAVACYLAQSILPHDRTGHGKIVAQTMVTAQRLLLALREFNSESRSGIKIVPLCQPETNVLCYLITAPGLIRRPRYLNNLSEKVFDRMTVEGERSISEYEYFISKTGFPYDKYESNIENLFEKASIPEEHRGDMGGEALTVLRSVVMNPLASEKEQSFFTGFWEEVASQAQNALGSILNEIVMEKNQGDRLRVLWVEDEAEFETMRKEIEIEESLGQYLDIERLSDPDRVGNVVDEFHPQLAIVDLNLSGNDYENVGGSLEKGLDVIDFLKGNGVDDLIVYSKYLREGATSIHVGSELEGKGVPPKLHVAKSRDAATRREKDVDELINTILWLVQERV